MVEEKTNKTINILNDACFKTLFRSVEARAMFTRFLSSLTGISKEALLNAKFVGGELTKQIITERGKIADIIIIVDEIEGKVIIEMNNSKSDDIFIKNTSYAFSNFIESTKIGTKKWPKIILVNIDNFNKFDTKEPILRFKLRDEFGNIENDAYHSIHIILENLKDNNYNIDKEISKFIKFITTEEFSKLEALAKGDNDYMAGLRKLEDLSTDPDFIGYYDYEEAKQFDLEDAKRTGIRIGREEMILNMKEKGLSLEMISEISKLSIEEVEKILNN